MAREYAPDEPATKQREFAPEPAAPKQDLYEKVSGQLREALPEQEGRQRFVGPMLAAGAGELARGVGAATQLVAPETGKKISDVGRAVVDVTKERYPVTGTLGQFGSYIYPYKAAETAVTKILPRTGTLGREAQIAGAAGGVTGVATSEGDLVDRAFGGALGTTLGIAGTYGAALATKGYQYTKDVLQKAFGGDAKRMSEALRNYASRRSGAEAEAAKKMATEAEQKAGIAETAEQKAARQQELAYRQLPGTTTEKEAGRFKAIPTSEQTVGDRIRVYVDRVFNDLKATRSKNAEKLKEEAFGLAKAREQQGLMPKDTEAFKKGMSELDSMIKTATLSDIKAPLQRVRNALDPVQEVEGVIVGKPVTFEGLEQLRRFLRDRSFGLPSEGFDAIGQQQAGKLADIVESVQREFTSGYPSLTAAVKGDKSSAFDRFLEQYRKDSEPLRVFKTKTGKLFEEQLPGVKGYAKVSSENIPNRVFKDRESYQGLIEAVGGNKAFAENEARKYFVGQMEKLAGDPKKLEDFIRDNRTMLNLTNARDIAESYIARASAFAKRGEAAKTRAGEERDIATKQAGLAKDFAKLESDLVTAQTPQEIAGLHETLAKKLLSEGTISQQQYRTMLQEANNVLQTVKDTSQAKQQLLGLTWRGVGGGVVGAGAYMGIKKFGE
jgi:hypothetical protein